MGIVEHGPESTNDLGPRLASQRPFEGSRYIVKIIEQILKFAVGKLARLKLSSGSLDAVLVFPGGGLFVLRPASTYLDFSVSSQQTNTTLCGRFLQIWNLYRVSRLLLLPLSRAQRGVSCFGTF